MRWRGAYRTWREERDWAELRQRIGLTIGATAFATLVISVTLHQMGYRVAYPLIVLYLAAIAATVLISRRTEAQPVPETVHEDPRVERAFPDADDAMRTAVERWDRRLTLREGGPDAPVSAILIELIDERLLLHHGLDRATHPERVQQMVSALMWALLSGPPRRVLSPQTMAALLSEMETW